MSELAEAGRSTLSHRPLARRATPGPPSQSGAQSRYLAADPSKMPGGMFWGIPAGQPAGDRPRPTGYYGPAGSPTRGTAAALTGPLEENAYMVASLVPRVPARANALAREAARSHSRISNDSGKHQGPTGLVRATPIGFDQRSVLSMASTAASLPDSASVAAYRAQRGSGPRTAAGRAATGRRVGDTGAQGAELQGSSRAGGAGAPRSPSPLRRTGSRASTPGLYLSRLERKEQLEGSRAGAPPQQSRASNGTSGSRAPSNGKDSKPKRTLAERMAIRRKKRMQKDREDETPRKGRESLSKRGVSDAAVLTAAYAENSTFFNVLRTLVSAVRIELLKGADDATLFVAPTGEVHDRFYPKAVEREHPEYFMALQVRASQRESQGMGGGGSSGSGKPGGRRRQGGRGGGSKSAARLPTMTLSQGHQTAHTATDDKLRYVFDRSGVETAGQQQRKRPARRRNNNNNNNKKTKTGGGSRSLGRLSASSSSQALVTRRRQGQSERGHGGGEGGSDAAPDWAELQRTAMEQKRQRCEHVLSILYDESRKEVQRQRALYDCPPSQVLSLRGQVARERAEAGDWIMRILQDYKMISATVMADYLRETLEGDAVDASKELEAIRDGRRIGRDHRGKTRDLLDLVAEDITRPDAGEIEADRQLKKWNQAARRARQGQTSGEGFEGIALRRQMERRKQREEDVIAEGRHLGKGRGAQFGGVLQQVDEARRARGVGVDDEEGRPSWGSGNNKRRGKRGNNLGAGAGPGSVASAGSSTVVAGQAARARMAMESLQRNMGGAAQSPAPGPGRGAPGAMVRSGPVLGQGPRESRALAARRRSLGVGPGTMVSTDGSVVGLGSAVGVVDSELGGSASAVGSAVGGSSASAAPRRRTEAEREAVRRARELEEAAAQRARGMTFSRTDLERSLELVVDTTQVRDTTSLMLDLLKQQPRDPPNARYSHLIGRFMSW